MHRGFTAELRRVFIITAIAIPVGLIIGYLAWTLIVAGGLYMAWTLWQIRRLDEWLNTREPGLPPDATGIWGAIFDRIYHLQKRQEREKLRLQSVINRVQSTTAALPDAVVLLDERGNMSWWNETASELMAFQVGDRNQPLTRFIRSPKFISYLEKGAYQSPINLSSPINDAKKLQIQITRYGQGERLVLIRDVTVLLRLEQIRKDFVANVSHELRTPLTVIKGYLETMGDHVETVAPKWEKPIVQMQEQCTRMTLLINDLITLSRLETEHLAVEQESVPLDGLVQTVRNEAEVLAKTDYSLRVESETDVSIRGVQKELHSALSNLVVNAIKYSPKGSEIVIRTYKDTKGVHIAVSDNGVGIDSLHIPRLTERFYRVDNSRALNTGGTGLGLAIVKHVLLRHGGHLAIVSEVNKGSTFTCSFPLARIVKPAV